MAQWVENGTPKTEEKRPGARNAANPYEKPENASGMSTQ